jgi:hypothetical protein
VRYSVGTVLLGAIAVLSIGVLGAQTTSDAVAEVPVVQSVSVPPADSQQQIDKRIFGVLPNYRTVNGAAPFMPITAKQKFTIAAKDSFDYPVYLISGAFGALYQLDDQNPSYEQGLKGYAKRYGSSYADQAIGNLMTEGLLPSVLHEDPRYFRLGTGPKWHRTGYALRGVMIAKNDSGKWTFNAAEWFGNSVAVGVSNLYYPEDTRNALDNAQKLLVQVATDAFSNVLKEFWPDIKQRLFKKKQ